MTTRHQLRQQLGTAVPAREERDWVFSTELQAEAGITYRQLDYWARTGLLTAIDDITPGSGHVRRFPEDQVARAVLVRDLIAAGTRLQQGVRDVIDQVADTGRLDLDGITITVHIATDGQAGDAA